MIEVSTTPLMGIQQVGTTITRLIGPLQRSTGTLTAKLSELWPTPPVMDIHKHQWPFTWVCGPVGIHPMQKEPLNGPAVPLITQRLLSP